MAFSRFYPVSGLIYDPDIAPTKAIQNVHAHDSAQWQQPSKQRFDTTYRTEYINRIRHPDQIARPIRNTNSSLNQYSVLPPIPSTTITTANNNNNNNSNNVASARSTRTDVSHQQTIKDQEVPTNQSMPKDIQPLDFHNVMQNSYDYQQQQQPMMNNIDTYLPEEPVLLTDYEEQRLSEQLCNQLGSSTAVDRLKLFYQELTAYDPNLTSYVHYSVIQSMAYQLGLNLQEDTLRFAMCKFVSPDRPRGYVHQQQSLSQKNNYYDNDSYSRHSSLPRQYQTQMRFGGSVVNDNDNESFDPDERQVRVLLKQNLKYFDINGSIDFDKLYREFKIADRNQTGVLNRQQIEEVIYKVRIPLQRSLIFQILEKHCRAYLRLYKWEAFFQYLKEQILDIKEVQDRSSPMYTQRTPNRSQWLDLIRREYSENDRLRIIEQYSTHNEGPRLESNNPSAWFARFLRLANAMYSHRASTNREHDFLLPREEARRLFRAYNQVWDLKIEEDKLQRVLDACARSGNTSIDDALKLLAK
ncbi:unnamed protein product [Rotaria sp. Silwood2]|nr:unnamed protein product [Rotaria sp. Silwood2]CAF2607666.1 unnamed protein product [Rotaria sp. Silwood2]CAF2849049.1 unnamed protein product [Rotaria sp. Silwood2]CAF3021643.1 unnamed protein product [Rotaria sp. Silwood2]CAF4167396.1 unnamed protein product [Rotaria sp. Silwood2]